MPPRVPNDENTRLLRWLEATVVPLVVQQGERAGVHGSGVVLRRSGQQFLVTATHVAKYFADHGEDIGLPLAPNTKDVEVWTIGQGQLALSREDNEDVAVFRLDDPRVVARLADGGWQFIDEDVSSMERRGVCIVFGWPDANSRFDGKVVSGKPIALKLARVSGPREQKATDIFVEWPAEEVPALLGISGSPIWAVSADGSRLQPLGVQHSVLHGEYIRGTSWVVVDELVRRLEIR